MGEAILVVSQEEALVSSLAEQLRRWDHTPLLARGEPEAADMMARHRPRLAVVDHAGGTDGLGLLGRLRNDYPWSEMILLVDLDRLEEGARCLELGASDFLVKPVSPSRLAIALKRAQERLSVKRKLAVLSGQPIDDPAAPELALLSEELARGTEAVIRLYDTQQQYQQLFNEVPCYIAVLDPSYRLVAVNRRFREDFGYAIGDHCFRVYKQTDDKCQGCPVGETFRDGQTHRFEQIITAMGGEQYNVLTYTAPLRNSQGQITHVMSMSVNITEIRKLQDHLSSLGMLLGSISHGVKGLLTALDGGMYSLKTGLRRGDDARVQKGWEVIQLMVERIKRTVLHVLYYAKDRELDSEMVDVAEFAQQLALTGRYAAQKHGLVFDYQEGEDLGLLQVDPNALNPALINILENAIDACLEDRARDGHRITFRVTREDDVVVFDIEDDGPGIDEPTQDKMFTLFFTSKGSAGTGLGLFIANDTVQQHGGTITVDSAPGEGTRFHVRIPIKPRAVLLAEQAAAQC